MKYTFAILFILSLNIGNAQKTFFEPTDTLIKKRLHWYAATAVTATVVNFSSLYFLWYKNVPQSSFHLIDDAGEWQQIDKVGHFYGSYLETKTAYQLNRWSGLNEKKSILYAGIVGFGVHSTIEVFDGFSQKWGASLSDIVANASGSLLFMSQQLAWGEQRIKLKYSYNEYSYNDPILQERSNKLYGTSFVERVNKNYNGINMWYSIMPSDFNKKQKHLKWLGFAIGYGAGGMFGGFENKWDALNSKGDTVTYDYSSTVRYRRFFIAPDIDLEKIKVKKRGWRMALSLLNYIKLPSPALEFNTKGEIIFYPIYNFSLNIPIYILK